MKIQDLFSDDSAGKIQKTIFGHAALLAALGALALFGCPFWRLLHVPCPCCGVTRAWLAFLGGNIRAAFEYHLLFPLLPFFLWLGLHRDALFMKRLLGTRGRRVLDIFLVCFAVLLAANHLFRMTLGKELGLFQAFLS